MYNIEDDDDQLIDLIIDVGDPYPKISKGNEVVPASRLEPSDVPLITVHVRKHIGKMQNSPFNVKQSQLVSFRIVSNIKHNILH